MQETRNWIPALAGMTLVLGCHAAPKAADAARAEQVAAELQKTTYPGLARPG